MKVVTAAKQIEFNQFGKSQPRGLIRELAKQKSQRTYNPVCSTFEETLLKNNELVTMEETEITGEKTSIKKKKEIISYTATRDALSIPVPERPKRPIDITKNLIEERHEPITADMGIQSDEILYVNPEKPYVPQKLGKDVGTQINDGDLFTFDRDVQPLLRVLIGKTIEQTLLEISQEDEINTLRDTKAAFIRKLNEDKKRIRMLEEGEISKKMSSDAVKEMRKIERGKRKLIQQKLMSRVFSKSFLKDFVKFSLNDLEHRGQLKDFTYSLVKNRVDEMIAVGSEKLAHSFTVIDGTLENVQKIVKQDETSKHTASVKRHKEELMRQREEAEKKRIEDEERARLEHLAKLEKRRLRKIERIRNEIQKGIIDAAITKGEIYWEEIMEIDNGEVVAPYVGIYGGVIGCFMLTLSILRKYFYTQDQLYTNENIIEILSLYFAECPANFNLFLDISIETVLATELHKPDIEIHNLKLSPDFMTEDWNKAGEILSNMNLNIDYIFKHFVSSLTDTIINPSFYNQIVKALFTMIDKRVCFDKINLVFRSPLDNNTDFATNIKKYEAFCIIQMPENHQDLLENVDYIKPAKKRAIKIPNFENEIKLAKLYQKTQEHNVILYDKTAEFVIRNKILECCLRIFTTNQASELDSKSIFKRFNEIYEENLDDSDIYNIVQFYSYSPFVNPPVQ